MAVAGEPAQVAGAEIACLVERVAVVLWMQVARQHLRAASADLTVDEDDVGDAWPSVGVGGAIYVVQGSDRGHRDLCRPVHAAHRGLVQVLRSAPDQRRRHRCAAADEHLQVGQAGPGALRSGQQTVQKRCRARHVGASVFEHQPHRHVSIPPLHQHRLRTEQQGAFERVDRSADVCDRGRDQKRVTGVDAPVVADLLDQRPQ